MDVSLYKMGRGFNLQINRIWFRGRVTRVCWAMVDFPAVWLSDTGRATWSSTPAGTEVLVRSVCVCSTGGVAVNISYVCAPQGVLSPSALDTELGGSPGADAKSASEPRLSERPSQRTRSSGLCGGSASPAFSGT